MKDTFLSNRVFAAVAEMKRFLTVAERIPGFQSWSRRASCHSGSFDPGRKGSQYVIHQYETLHQNFGR